MNNIEKEYTGGNNGSQPMRVSEGLQVSVPAYRHLCQRIGTQARNPALAVAANVGAQLNHCLVLWLVDTFLTNNR